MATKKKPAAPVKKKVGPPLRRTEKQKRDERNRRRREKRATQKTEAETPPACTVTLRKKPTPGTCLGLRPPQVLTGIPLIDGKNISDIDTKTKEGRLLMAALSVLTTSKSIRLIGKDRDGCKMTPFEILDELKDLAEDIYRDADPPVSNVFTIKAGQSALDLLRSGNYDRALIVDNDGNIWGVPTPDGKLAGFKLRQSGEITKSIEGNEKSPLDFASDFCRGLNFYPAGKQNDILREVVSTIKNRNGVNLERVKQKASEAAVAMQISQQIVRETESQAKAQDLILSGGYDALRLEGSEED